MSPPAGAPPLQPACPVCAAALAEDQAWCLECGAAARTRIAPTPRHWRAITAILVIASVLAIIAIAIAGAKLARADARPSLTSPAYPAARPPTP